MIAWNQAPCVRLLGSQASCQARCPKLGPLKAEKWHLAGVGALLWEQAALTWWGWGLSHHMLPLSIHIPFPGSGSWAEASLSLICLLLN